ncbi:Choline/Carnitine o-acyltransferase-domain-containing protein [Multifurca ochricompacta]|uniref:Choline/Carnitine o-acyltransferase-domain-containing protein n=1 Tax=Multifurca ochricompacta TaxID=376703 RepID=A0AAD4QNP1_9AGAM|nr:Choline/Carnitine o-acyltransferase-domain-containing protein [Multifurca ochricompacta]
MTEAFNNAKNAYLVAEGGIFQVKLGNFSVFYRFQSYCTVTEFEVLLHAPSASTRRALSSSAANGRPPSLPRLPVPALQQTLPKYLRSLVPFLQEDEVRGGPSWRSALQKRQQWADEFERGIGAKCQERLSSPRNWLDDNIWLKKTYHECRSPLLIHSNWRAAWLTYRHLEFKDSLARQEIYPNTTRTAHCDSLSPQPSPHLPNARKITVMINDWLYAVEQRLRSVVHDEPVPVGILSADDRNRWTENLRYVLSLAPTNQQTLEVIQQSIFAVSLDSHTLGFHSPNSTHSARPPLAIGSLAEVDSHLHNIRSSINARNRWFDKAYTLIIETNTRAGAMGEHSPCDALLPSIVADYAVVQSIIPEALNWVTDARIIAECIAAESRAKNLIADSDDSVLWFSDYGQMDKSKVLSGLAPDGYVQMALQLAWYKSRGNFTATYETALTRAFDKARTETIRTLTEDSRAWVLSMADPSASTATRLALLRRAIQTHSALTREAATGRGIDRHLLGLRLMMRPGTGERAALFEDPLFERSQEWKLSTSALSAGNLFRGTGFGAPYHDGYGINSYQVWHRVETFMRRDIHGHIPTRDYKCAA